MSNDQEVFARFADVVFDYVRCLHPSGRFGEDPCMRCKCCRAKTAVDKALSEWRRTRPTAPARREEG